MRASAVATLSRPRPRGPRSNSLTRVGAHEQPDVHKDPAPSRGHKDLRISRAPRVDAPSRIKPELAHMFERALRDEAGGKSIVMREPRIVRKFPKGPSYW